MTVMKSACNALIIKLRVKDQVSFRGPACAEILISKLAETLLDHKTLSKFVITELNFVLNSHFCAQALFRKQFCEIPR
jgi:hypothetical protein